MSEQIYIYYNNSESKTYQEVCKFFQEQDIQCISLGVLEDSLAQEEIKKWSNFGEDIFPIVRVGEKIKIVFFNPPKSTLSLMFGENSLKENSLASQALTIYSADWCPDCRRLEGFLDKSKKKYSKIDIENTPGAPELIISWSGGRRVIPTMRIGESVLLFNPSIKVVESLLFI